MSKASYVESSAGSRLSAFHALSQRDDVNWLEQTLGKGENGHLLRGRGRGGGGGGALIRFSVGKSLRRQWRLFLHSQKCLGKEGGSGEGSWPTRATSLGSKVSKHSQEGSKGDFHPTLDVG